MQCESITSKILYEYIPFLILYNNLWLQNYFIGNRWDKDKTSNKIVQIRPKSYFYNPPFISEMVFREALGFLFLIHGFVLGYYKFWIKECFQ